MTDARTPLQKWLWDRIGPPLYYCGECMLPVKVVIVAGADPKISRCCDHHGAQVIAPRKSTLVGKGGMSLPTRVKVTMEQFAAALTGRCV